MVSTSEVSVSVTTDSAQNLDRAVGELTKEFDVSMDRGRSIVCVVGEGMRNTPGVAGQVFGALQDPPLNVQMISQGASKVNLAFVIASDDVPAAVRSLHQKLFES
jgi:aspartate kinase